MCVVSTPLRKGFCTFAKGTLWSTNSYLDRQVFLGLGFSTVCFFPGDRRSGDMTLDEVDTSYQNLSDTSLSCADSVGCSCWERSELRFIIL